MNKNYSLLASNIKQRLNPENLYEAVDRTRILNKALRSEALGSLSYDDVDEFVYQSMKSVGQEYTDKTIQAGSMVKQHLKTGLIDVDYEYQGSVMTNTHIKGYSDIDLVCISSKFYTYTRMQVQNYLQDYSLRSKLNETAIKRLEAENTGSSYAGNSIEDLKKIRLDSEAILLRQYDKCSITHPKAIKITNQNLRRDVDIVTAGWYDDVRAIINGKGNYRGIALYNKATNSQENPDYPFTCIQLINDRGTYTGQRLKKMIRFLKNVRSFSDRNIDLSSFIINAICYNISTVAYLNATENTLVDILHAELHKICTDRSYADDIVSVDGREYIYRYNTQAWNETHKLYQEVAQICVDLRNAVTV